MKKYLLKIQSYLKIRKSVKLHNKIERLEKQLVKFRGYTSKCEQWIGDDKSRLQLQLGRLSKDEVVRFGFLTGYLGDEVEE